MITPTASVNQPTNSTAGLNSRWIVQKMQDVSVFSFRDFRDAQPAGFWLSSRNDPPSVKHLSAAGGIKRGAIQNEGRTRIHRSDIAYFRVELVQEGVVIIKVLSHG
jgi:hypothetical protein